MAVLHIEGYLSVALGESHLLAVLHEVQIVCPRVYLRVLQGQQHFASGIDDAALSRFCHNGDAFLKRGCAVVNALHDNVALRVNETYLSFLIQRNLEVLGLNRRCKERSCHEHKSKIQFSYFHN